jgi:hypothetical protein
VKGTKSVKNEKRKGPGMSRKLKGAVVKNKWRQMHKKRLQREVMADIVEQGLSDRQAESKYRLRSGSIVGWFEEERFRTEMECAMEAAKWKAGILVAHGACVAVKRLLALTECKTEETRRKACLDVIGMLPKECIGKSKDQRESPLPPLPFSDKTVSGIFNLLAEEEGQAVDEPSPQQPAAGENSAG